MGRSVSYPSGALVAFTVLAVEDRDANEHDLDVEYEWLCGDLAERAAAFPSLARDDGWRGREDRILMRGCPRGLRGLGLRRPGCGLDRRA